MNFFPHKRLCAGGPPEASQEELARAKKEAARASSQNRARNTSGFSTKLLGASLADPDSMEDSEDEGGDLELWRLLPQLKDLPEALLTKASSVGHVSAKHSSGQGEEDFGEAWDQL